MSPVKREQKKRMTFSVEYEAGVMMRDYAHERGRMVESVFEELIRLGIPMLRAADDGRAVMLAAAAQAAPRRKTQ